MQSLKKRYTEKKFLRTIEKAKKADNLLREQRNNLLKEALDEAQIEMANQIIKKLRMIESHAAMKAITKSNRTAAQELGQAFEFAIKDALKSLEGGVRSKNLLDNAAGFIDILETGFRQLQTILDANLKDFKQYATGNDKTVTINDAIDKEDPDSTTHELSIRIKNLITKAFVPSQGWRKVVGKIPYLQTDIVSSWIMNTPISSLDDFVKAIASGYQLPPSPPADSENKKESEIQVDTSEFDRLLGIKDEATKAAFIEKILRTKSPNEEVLKKAIEKVQEIAKEAEVPPQEIDGFIRGLMYFISKGVNPVVLGQNIRNAAGLK